MPFFPSVFLGRHFMNFASSSFFYLRKAILFVCPFFSSFAFGAGNVAICMHAPIYVVGVLGIRVFGKNDHKDCIFLIFLILSLRV